LGERAKPHPNFIPSIEDFGSVVMILPAFARLIEKLAPIKYFSGYTPDSTI